MTTHTVNSRAAVDREPSAPHKLEIVAPYRYSAWPMLGRLHGTLICFYTEADAHETNETTMHMVTSADGGLTWTEKTPVFTDKTRPGGVTGLGNDSQGNLLVWYRDGRPSSDTTVYEVYRYDGAAFTKISTVDYGLCGPHIGFVFAVPEKGLFAFYNTYGDVRSYGVLKSADDGVTWTNHPIGVDIVKPECPVELDGFYAGDGRIFALGRKDAPTGNVAMFQIESADGGETWTRAYTNVTDACGSSPNMIYDSATETVYLYYFARDDGRLMRRVSALGDVWNAPENWSDSATLITEPYRGQDAGNVKVVEGDGYHFATYYAGTELTTGIYGAIVSTNG